jgi:hypothetical protein
MTRVLLAAAALAALPVASRAGEPVQLTVAPMAAPRPALKYLLLPEVREQSTGNPVQWYVRCFQEQRNFFFNKASMQERARYRALPLAELPADQLRDYGRYALRQADWAARLDTCDWDVLQRVQSGGSELRLPELGPLRVLGEALQVRFRGAVAGRRFDDAIVTAKTMFALARHLGKCPAGSSNLLGLSIADLALDTLEEMEQQPGCPNLYWALTDLPCPLVELRKGLQGDRVRAAADLRALRNNPMTEADLEAVVTRLSGAIGFAREQTGRPPWSLRATLRAGVKDVARLRAARARLIEAGCKADQVEKLPPVQVLLLEMKGRYEEQRDEQMKLLALAPGQVALLNGKEAGGGPLADLLPDVRKARDVQARLEQRVGLLRHVEALRLYAAAHQGKLPAKLSDCPVPLPDDPFTGKPFHYEVKGNTAHLRGSPSADRAKDASSKVHYQVTMK